MLSGWRAAWGEVADPRWPHALGCLPGRSEPAPGQDLAAADRRSDRRAVVTRHCWVTGLPDCPGRWAGLLIEWRREPDTGRWSGRVVYCVDEAGCGVLVETRIDADHLAPA